MIFEVAIGDKLRTVGIVRKGGMLHVDLDGRTHIVDARRISDAVVSMLVQAAMAAAPSRSIDAAFAARSLPAAALAKAGAATSTCISMGGPSRCRSARPARSGVRTRRRPAPRRAARSASSPRCRARSCACWCKPGDEVKARQGLVVVEAMKMENELRAARDGRVRDVAVAEGQSVDAGAVLLVVE